MYISCCIVRILDNTGSVFICVSLFFLLHVDVLRGYAQEVESRDGRHLRDTPSSFSGHMGAGMVCVCIRM